MELTLAYLYPKLLNIYGDQGNVLALTYRAQKRGIKLIVKNVNVGNSLKPGSFDLLFAGGGQDQQQIIASRDLQSKKRVLLTAAKRNVPMLTICGSYQLFGEYFKPFKGPKLKGIGLFPAHTIASHERKIGNILINSQFGQLIGFENHSGNTYLDDQGTAFGKVIIGSGNNDTDQTEGCRIKNVFGCYLHGSLLPKNPKLCDYLLVSALQNRYGKIKFSSLNDQLETSAHDQVIKRTKKLAHPLLKYL
jgi:hypothetical protein